MDLVERRIERKERRTAIALQRPFTDFVGGRDGFEIVVFVYVVHGCDKLMRQLLLSGPSTRSELEQEGKTYLIHCILKLCQSVRHISSCGEVMYTLRRTSLRARW